MRILNNTLNHKVNTITGKKVQLYLSQLQKYYPNVNFTIDTDALYITLPNETNTAATYTCLDNLYLVRNYGKPNFSASTIADFLLCQKKWKKLYRDYEWQSDSIAFQFGTFVHTKLAQYPNIVVTENERPDLKDYSGITSWTKYFAKIKSNLDIVLKEYDIIAQEKEYIVDAGEFILHGTIDLVAQHKITKRILITDYKTYSQNPKTAEDIFLYVQMSIYAYLYSMNNKVDSEIDMMYVSIPKVTAELQVLANGKLSKNKSQKIDKNTFLTYCAEHNINPLEYMDLINCLPEMFIIPTEKIEFNENIANKTIEIINNVYKDSIRGYLTEQQGFECGKCLFKEKCKL